MVQKKWSACRIHLWNEFKFHTRHVLPVPMGACSRLILLVTYDLLVGGNHAIIWWEPVAADLHNSHRARGWSQGVLLWLPAQVSLVHPCLTSTNDSDYVDSSFTKRTTSPQNLHVYRPTFRSITIAFHLTAVSTERTNVASPNKYNSRLENPQSLSTIVFTFD